ncbi:hypothetical protein D1872_242630 [compost metagenome]
MSGAKRIIVTGKLQLQELILIKGDVKIARITIIKLLVRRNRFYPGHRFEFGIDVVFNGWTRKPFDLRVIHKVVRIRIELPLHDAKRRTKRNDGILLPNGLPCPVHIRQALLDEHPDEIRLQYLQRSGAFNTGISLGRLAIQLDQKGVFAVGHGSKPMLIILHARIHKLG